VGAAPDGTQTYKCPSYRYNSNERCSVTLTAPGHVFLTATGDKGTQASSFLVRAFSRLPSNRALRRAAEAAERGP
jgi:hypothetical protein